MAMKSLRKISTKLQLLYGQNDYLSAELRRWMCNSLVQPHFNYACVFRYPLISQKIRMKIEVAHNKCSCFCLKLK